MYYHTVALFVSMVIITGTLIYILTVIHDDYAINKLLFLDSTTQSTALQARTVFTKLYKYDLRYDDIRGRTNGRFIVGLTENQAGQLNATFRVLDQNDKVISEDVLITNEIPQELIFSLNNNPTEIYLAYTNPVENTAELDRIELQI